MKKKFLTNLALLLFLNLLVKPFWVFGIDRGIQNAVGSEEYGLYFSLLNFSFLLNVLLDLGITQFTNRTVAQHPGLISRYFSQVIILRLFLGLVYAGLTLFAGLLLQYSSRQFYLLGFLVLNQFLLSFILYLRSNLSGLLLLRTDSLVSVLDRGLMILFCSFLLWGKHFRQPIRIEWFVYAQTLAYLITVLVVFTLVLPRLGTWSMVHHRLRTLVILKQSIPFAILVLCMSLYHKIDAVMLERMLPDGKEQAGIYAQSFRVLDAFSMVAFLYAGLLFPIFSRMIRSHQPVQTLAGLSWSTLMLPVVPLVVASVMYRTELMILLYPEASSSSFTVFPLLMISLLAVSTSYIFGTLMTAHGNLRLLIGIALAGVTVNIFVNAFLIPSFAVTGAAWANLVTQVLVALAQGIAALRILSFTTRWVQWLPAHFFVTGMMGAGWLIHHSTSSWIVGFSLIIAAGLALGLLTGMIRVREWIRIWTGKDESY